MDEYFWVKYRSGKWVIAERRNLDRWFVCGVGHIMNRVSFDHYRSSKSCNSIVEVGEKIKCPYDK